MSDQQEKDTLELFEDAPGDGAGAPPVPDFEEEIREVPPAENTPPPPGLQPRISDIEGEESFGQYLRALRERNHFTIAEIANETKIKSDYLTALENEDYGSLPQPVYVLGYVRKLCSLYHVSPERADQITAELRDRLEYEVPEDITKTVIDHEVSEENERKIRQLILILAASALLVAVVLVAGGILILAGLRSSGSSPKEPRFTESQAVEVQDAPKLIITELIP